MAQTLLESFRLIFGFLYTRRSLHQASIKMPFDIIQTDEKTNHFTLIGDSDLEIQVFNYLNFHLPLEIALSIEQEDRITFVILQEMLRLCLEIIPYYGQDDFFYAFAERVDLEKFAKLREALSSTLRDLLFQGSDTSIDPRLLSILS